MSTSPSIPTNGQPRRAFLVGLSLPGQPGFVVEEHLDELAELAASGGLIVAGRTQQNRKKPDVKTYIGSGKAAEIVPVLDQLDADLVIFDDDLAPNQVRNLEEIFKLQVMDRSALILEIFVQRARSREARTQVQLAQLNYMLPRLTRRWTHLSRQVGGIGVRGGEGETQLEADRRILRGRIKHLKKELAKIERSRAVQRRGRQAIDQIALAGYTNAGKSTLFNALTRAGAHVEDRLFATLDSRLRRGALEPGRTVVFADTVGFIRKLPHHLVASFRSTLEEITVADVVLNVIDRSHPQWREHTEIAQEILADLGVEKARVIEVFNKTDLMGDIGNLNDGPNGYPGAVWVSATTGAGIPELKTEILIRLKGPAALPAEGAATERPASTP